MFCADIKQKLKTNERVADELINFLFHRKLILISNESSILYICFLSSKKQKQNKKYI